MFLFHSLIRKGNIAIIAGYFSGIIGNAIAVTIEQMPTVGLASVPLVKKVVIVNLARLWYVHN
jgi:hypothetical protein